MTLVLDASVTLSWFFEDEAGDHAVLHAVSETGAHVPSIWRLEVANAMQFAVRRKRLDFASRDTAITKLKMLSITIDPLTNQQAWSETLRLADRFALTAYDAAYLELASRLRLPIATLDRALADAARAGGVAVLPT